MFRRFFLLAALILAPLVHAHEEGPDRKELAAIYRGLLDSVVSLQQTIDDKRDNTRVEGAFVIALMQFLKLHEAQLKAECPKCDTHALVQPRRGAVRATAEWFVSWVPWIREKYKGGKKAAWEFLKDERSADVVESWGKMTGLVAHGYKLAGGGVAEVFSRYGYTYGVIWFLATAVFETVEHALQFHLGCAAFQAGYHLTGGMVLGTYRVGLNPCGDTNLAKRFWNAFPANIYDWKFWWRLSAFFRKAPALVVDDHNDAQYSEKVLEEYAAEIEKFLAEKSFSDEARAHLSGTRTGWRPPTLVEDLETVFNTALPSPTRQFVAKQHVEGLTALLAALRDAVRGRAKELTQEQYFLLKSVVGTLGRLLDEYGSSLAAAALANTIERPERKLEGLRWVLGEIMEIYRRPEMLTIFDEVLPDLDVYRALKREITAVRNLQRELRRGNLQSRQIPACSVLLSGRAA